MTTEEMYCDTIGLLPIAYNPELGHNATDTAGPLFDEWLRRVNALGMKFVGVLPASVAVNAAEDLIADYPDDATARFFYDAVLDGAKAAQHSPFDMVDFPVFLPDSAVIVRTVTAADVADGFPNGKPLPACSQMKV